ncbi:G-protein beta WD-40 repeats containing protein [Reticulomyxa filosa]|uniref:G-protein beta WD-40 repeats containing protein n=1 Tax=Reticulomyxa filosa TaxID=46433 RepID=X6NIZ5_RETFI|nr:G-protein beta WD-40 repeats containing protein [Reticulomyxa filosa]|eukprot:ETO25322.1 G-protein beta WD-40 repeats containing protein [Reticulomyxa filosa]
MNTNGQIEEATSTHFESLNHLPVSLTQGQCVIHQHEILICGGYCERRCFSYHTLKGEYKLICSYPENVSLHGHCVVKRVNDKNPNDISVLFLCGSKFFKRHTLIMRYVSVWDNDGANIELDSQRDYNKWVPLTNSEGKPIVIGRPDDDYVGVRALVGGSENHLLFITYPSKNIDVFDLNICQFIKHDTLPFYYAFGGHCFVAKRRNDKKMCEMVVFSKHTGISITYDEVNNSFTAHSIQVCTTLRPLNQYAYIYVNDFILIFGGDDRPVIRASNSVYRYSMTKDKWMKFEQTLPIQLTGCAGVLSEDDLFIHIIGGSDGKGLTSTHLKTEVKTWMKEEETEIEKQWNVEETEKIEIEEIKHELEKIKDELDIRKLKKDIETIIEHWMKPLSIQLGWVDDFNIMICRYILRKYFKPLHVVQRYSCSVKSLQFSSNCTKLVLALSDETIRILDAKQETEIQILKGHSDFVYDAKFSLTGNMVVSGSKDATIRLWDVKSGSEIRILKGHTKGVTKVNFSPDEKIIVSSSQDQTIRIWSVQSGKETNILKGHSSVINDVQFSPDGHQLLSASNDETIINWNVSTGEIVKKLKGNLGSVYKVKFSPDGLLFASCSLNKTVQIWNVMTGTLLQKLVGHFAPATDVHFSSDGKIVISCSMDNTIRLWDVKLGVEIQKLEGHSGYMTGLDISADGNRIVSASNDGVSKYNYNYNKAIAKDDYNFVLGSKKNYITHTFSQFICLFLKLFQSIFE